ncbi:ParA family protein [Mobilitalea sibirica]|uniref:ParA family protein n=1 Tax=Mobilitalea sibirica TaxID=1462919 RepID=A0A8J7HCY4_9FIRM|nr:ParA family protein [Mobilitalea sibirica]MBH1942536.1 ParA family protein [Mobilitalea sibirica]
MEVIVIANQKGGIGKTTTATALSSILTKLGYNTLLIDADMQGNSTDTYRGEIEGAATLYDVLLETGKNRVLMKDAVQKTEVGQLIAADPLLRKSDEVLNGDVNGLYRLQDALTELKGYDYIVIDTAPSMNTLLYNCLIAATKVIIPVTADRYGLQGLSQLSQTIQAIKKRQNPNLYIAGLLLVKFNPRTNLSQEVRESLETIAEQMNTKLFKTFIRESVKAREAQALRNALIDYAPNSTTSLDYIEFTNELLKGDRYGIE